jgi:hypothetical protein
MPLHQREYVSNLKDLSRFDFSMLSSCPISDFTICWDKCPRAATTDEFLAKKT